MVKMSKIGKLPIPIPEGVNVTISESKIVVNGPNGTLDLDIPRGIKVTIEETEEGEKVIKVSRESDKKQFKMLHGTIRALINNMVIGVTQGFTKELELHGVGYKVELEGNKLKLHLGLNHPIYVTIPEDLRVEVPSSTEIKIWGIDKQKVGNFAAYIRHLKKPDPYKGKGIRYKGEQIKLKEIKTLGA